MLSKLSYINRVINDVLPTEIKKIEKKCINNTIYELELAFNNDE